MDKPEEKVSNYIVVSKIPAPVGRFRRSASVRVRGEKANMLSISDTRFPSILEREEFSLKDNRNRSSLSLNLNRSRSQASVLNGNLEDDLDSLDSFVSNASAISTKSSCEHAHFAKNGTTYSGRLHRYIVHCQTTSTEPEEYLTPTQRANKRIKRLKSLLQLAKEKLREKEEEIFRLTREVVELKVFKASANSQCSDSNSPSEAKDLSSEKEENSVINCDASVQALNSPDDIQKLKDFPCDTYNDFSPMKNSFYFEDNNEELLKMSPVSPQHCFGEKTSATPDFLLSSLADSGNFDDMASSVSLHSKDSIGFTITPDFRLPHGEKLPDEVDSFDLKEGDSEKFKILTMYENKLKEKKLEYELELKRIVDEQEEKNVKMMREFEEKLKEEELKFEERWMKLLKTSEEEKQAIVDRFERKLAEEKEKYMEDLVRSQRRKASESFSGDSYIRTVEEEKSIYESSLQRIKSKFENEKLLIETSYDEALKQERKKFEESISIVKETSDCRIKELLNTIAELEDRFFT
ncbi:UNVERIFIED_CONTAM: hypothetical protein PYX00_002733 [Menopon gallinae]|uniref:Uncharacterized protein n=1 Tax=Menopon gallinae TaxID=328185 RepID=A0AAW2HXW2_9NEOP